MQTAEINKTDRIFNMDKIIISYLYEWLDNFELKDRVIISYLYKSLYEPDSEELFDFKKLIDDIYSKYSKEIFIISCEEGNLEITQYIYTQYSEIDISFNNYEALCTACHNGNYEIVKWITLIDPIFTSGYHSKIYELVQNEYLNFKLICGKGYTEIVKLLIELSNNTIPTRKSPSKWFNYPREDVEDAYLAAKNGNHYEICHILFESIVPIAFGFYKGGGR